MVCGVILFIEIDMFTLDIIFVDFVSQKQKSTAGFKITFRTVAGHVNWLNRFQLGHVMHFIHEPLDQLWRATSSHILTIVSPNKLGHLASQQQAGQTSLTRAMLCL